MGEKPSYIKLVFDGLGLKPLSAFDLEMLLEKCKAGDVVNVRILKKANDRSYQHLKLYWAVLKMVVDATDSWFSSEDLHEAIKLELRMVRGLSQMNGGVRFITRSTDFESMDQREFALFFKKAMLAIEEATGIDTDELIEKAKLKCHYQEAA